MSFQRVKEQFDRLVSYADPAMVESFNKLWDSFEQEQKVMVERINQDIADGDAKVSESLAEKIENLRIELANGQNRFIDQVTSQLAAYSEHFSALNTRFVNTDKAIELAEGRVRADIVVVDGKVAALGIQLQDLSKKVDRLEVRLDGGEVKMDSFEAKIETRLDSFEAKIETRLDGFRSEVDQQFSRFEQRVDSFENKVLDRLDKQGAILTELTIERKWDAGKFAALVAILGLVSVIASAATLGILVYSGLLVPYRPNMDTPKASQVPTALPKVPTAKPAPKTP
jgi:hypothetical protein